MRVQRRPAVSLTLVHIDPADLGNTVTTVITDAIFQPEAPGPQNVDQAQPVYIEGAFDLPGVHVASAGDLLVVDGGEEWQVLSDGIVWLNRTRVPVATDTFPDVVSLRAPGGTTTAWDEEQGAMVPVPHEPFATDLPARVQAVGGTPTSEPDVVEETVTVAGYRVSLALTEAGAADIAVDGESNTLVDVTSSPDPLLVGKTLRVTDIVRGSHRFERVLLCTLTD